MTRRRIHIGLGLAAASLAGVAAGLWLASTPDPLVAPLPERSPDPANGRVLYHAGSCGACHRAADAAHPHADLPIGGAPFPTPLGTFYPGNLTPDLETGLGAWSETDFANAMLRGLSPDGRHYFPAFPYTSFRHMSLADVSDLRAFLMSLPAVRSPARPPSLPLLGMARRGVGLWKRLAGEGITPPPEREPSSGASWSRGAYLTHTVGHCGECHTPRDGLMAMDPARLFVGGPHPAGDGKVPGLRGLIGSGRYTDAADLATALQYGETYGYDRLSSGGMGRIQENLAKLPHADLQAIAEYLASLEP